MRTLLKYNYLSQVVPQIPDRLGILQYKNYYKYDLIIKNESNNHICNQRIKVAFNKKAKIIKTNVPNSNNKFVISNNIATITIDQIAKKQSENFDFYVKNIDLKDDIKVIPIKPETKILRSKKIPVKNKDIKKKVFINKSKIKAFFYDPYIVKIIGGLAVIIVVSSVGYFFSSGNKNSSNNSLKVDSLKTKKNDRSAIDTNNLNTRNNNLQNQLFNENKQTDSKKNVKNTVLNPKSKNDKTIMN